MKRSLDSWRGWSMVVRLVFGVWMLWLSTAALHAAEEFLDPAAAFKFDARMVDADTIEARWTVANGYYMYREKFAFKTDGAAQLGQEQLPRGVVKFDDTFGKDVETMRGEVIARIPVVQAAERFKLVATGQGCADEGLCYPPQDITVELVRVASAAPNGVAVPTSTDNEQSRIESTLRTGSLLAVMPAFLGLGLLLSFTPCVLPMVPILSSVIVGHAGGEGAPKRLTRARGFSLALAYALGMSIIYTAMGVAAGLAGEGLAAALQTPAVLLSFAALLVALALSMFGFYELQLPSALQSKLTGAANQQRGGSYLGAFVMGALSALIVGPCVAAPLAGALVYISQTRDVVIGGGALFAMAVGMSVPLLLVGASAGSLLPRAGAWMQGVKHFFGVLLLGVALWMVSPIVPAWLYMASWAALLIVCAIYLRVLDPLPHDASGWQRWWKGIGVVLLLLGVVLVIGLAMGNRDILRPLANVVTSPSAKTKELAWTKITSVEQLDAALAATQGRPAMLDFYADWCVSCKEMERFTFADATVATRLESLVLLKADVTKNDANDKALLKRFNLFGPPGIIFFDAQGREIKTTRVIGFQNARRFLASIERAVGPSPSN
ncbi:MAG TPA: protein-disulfide reductase DsbD [Burkholderiaceae bacterium]|nr:protein-disulfide reductase DsbD [Burkholderiaceae bacterium]